MTTLNKKTHQEEEVNSKSFESSGMQFPLYISKFKDEFEKSQNNLAKLPYFEEFSDFSNKLFQTDGQFTKYLENFLLHFSIQSEIYRLWFTTLY